MLIKVYANFDTVFIKKYIINDNYFIAENDLINLIKIPYEGKSI